MDCRFEGDEELPFAAEMTFEPKNFRSSASLSRCCTETDSNAANERAVAGDEAGPVEDASCWLRSGYFKESSASALSTSSISSFCFSFAFCFFRAFRSFLEAEAGVDGDDASSESGGGSDVWLTGCTEAVATALVAAFFFFFFYYAALQNRIACGTKE